jgi:hypothetical protein
VLHLVDEALVLLGVHPVREGSQLLAVCDQVHSAPALGQEAAEHRLN